MGNLKSSIDNLTYQEAIELFTYNPITGEFIINSTGKSVGCKNKRGYIQISLNRGSGKYELGHRLATLLMLGHYPKGIVDHLDGCCYNNSWSNLRQATSRENNYNASIRSDNTSGVKGVHWAKKARRWVAKLKVNGKQVSVGSFVLLEEAEIAIKVAREKCHGDFANHG